MSHGPGGYRGDDDEEERGFLQRFGFPIGIGVLVIAGVLILAGRNLFSGNKQAARKMPEVMLVMPKLPPPPPPPPQPKPPEQKMEQQKMIEQAPVDKDEEKPDDKPAEAPQAATTNIQGSGGPDFGLRGGNGGGFLSGNGRHGSGTRWGWYAAKCQNRVGEALRKSSRTKNSSINSIVVRLWPDATTGRIVRAKLAASTGDQSLDNAISNEILTGLQLDEPPPSGMPSPIVMRIAARRPH